MRLNYPVAARLETTAGKWDLDGVMKIPEREVEARELASTTGTPAHTRKTQVWIPTGAALLASNSGSGSGGPNCVYCGQGHTSTSCATITDVTARKEILRKTGRCYGKITSAGIAVRPPVAGHVGGDTTSASVPDGTRMSITFNHCTQK